MTPLEHVAAAEDALAEASTAKGNKQDALIQLAQAHAMVALAQLAVPPWAQTNLGHPETFPP
jgi:hypothetical protein